MKYYLVPDSVDSTKYAIVGARGFTPPNVIVEAPKDANGDYILDADIMVVSDVADTMLLPQQTLDVNGNPVFETLQRPTYDIDGNAILDANGDPVMEDYQSPVYDLDANGDVIMVDTPTGTTHKEVVVDATLKAQKDAVLLQNAKNAKLERIRDLRKPLLEEVDLMVNDLALGDRTDMVAVKTYRDALKALTDPYKDSSDTTGKTALDTIDALQDDLSDLVLPTKP